MLHWWNLISLDGWFNMADRLKRSLSRNTETAYNSWSHVYIVSYTYPACQSLWHANIFQQTQMRFLSYIDLDPSKILEYLPHRKCLEPAPTVVANDINQERKLTDDFACYGQQHHHKLRSRIDPTTGVSVLKNGNTINPLHPRP